MAAAYKYRGTVPTEIRLNDVSLDPYKQVFSLTKERCAITCLFKPLSELVKIGGKFYDELALPKHLYKDLELASDFYLRLCSLDAKADLTADEAVEKAELEKLSTFLKPMPKFA